MAHGTSTISPTFERAIAAYLDSAEAGPGNIVDSLYHTDLAAASPHAITEYLAQGREARLVGVFPGLGSRAAYRDLGSFLLDAGIDEIAGIYDEAAHTLGVAPARLLGSPDDLPTGRLARQGHIGTLVVTHSLALEAYLRATAERNGTALTFRAYTGESFGILSAAMASGSLSVADGTRIAKIFTPLSLVAAEGLHDGEPLARELAEYLPADSVGRPVAPEPYHVLGVQGPPDVLAAAFEQVSNAFDPRDVEVHKRYSPTQTNVYVRAGARTAFDRLVRGLGPVEVSELKEPTTFLAHSARMAPVRTGLEWFMEVNGIQAMTPRVPVIANHRSGVLTAAEDVHEAILAMTDQVMDSHATVEVLDALHSDLAIELGPGEKSVKLLQDSNARTPVIAYTGASVDAHRLFRAINGVSGLKRELEQIRSQGDQLEPRHLEVLRSLFRSFADDPFTEAYTARAISRIVTREMLRTEQDGSPAYYRLLEAFQHTLAHRHTIDVGAGELVLRSRRKKRTVGDRAHLGRNYLELRTVDARGTFSDRCVADTGSPETLVLRFTGLSGADDMILRRQVRRLVADQPLARMVRESLTEHSGHAVPVTGTVDRITYHYSLYHLMRLYRPAVLAQRDQYLQGDDPLGWLSALAVSGAASPADVVELYELRRHGTHDRDLLVRALDRLEAVLRDARTPVIAPDGVPLYGRRDIATATRAVFLDGVLDAGVRATHLAGETWTVSFLPAAAVRPGAGTPERTIVLTSDLDLSKRGVNVPLDRLDDDSALDLTVEKRMVLHHAQGRRILSTTVNGYIGSDERVVGFGKGGSESMTVFLVKDGSTRTVVRKILSEALVTAAWRPDGTGVMLPPFAKARQQAEFLRHLPDPVNRHFPEVYDVLERELPAAGQDGPATHHEVIYEMSFVPGDEVSRYIERCSPPPRVVAKIYQAIYQVLEHDIHAVGRVPAPGGTLEESYLRKIEDRLELCRRTAPRTFGTALLDPETITVNGVTQRNALALVRWFREHPEHHEILEPRFHSLVMGDTNTENIKLTHTAPLRTAQRLIEEGAPRREVDAALAAITPATLGIKFLDPRAIGYRSTGRATIDDPMYDNKPWHNSIGHYDEMHFEHFRLDVRTSATGAGAHVRIEFDEGNPFQRAYQVRDVVERGLDVDHESPRGMEDHFATVMTEALGLDDPASPYLADDPYWLVRFVFMMGTHFTAMPPFHFQAELDGTLTDTYHVQRRPVAIYCEGIKWLNWTVEILEGRRTSFLGVPVPALP
ncbi:ACP S-malonyltransferase [Myceligenerans salitolerans]|uniref:[acyl-carrier-protein] S-malonyltransferase n=1 Tax=Myceligenerans salitolerans TaxID=1230528 RepID=A0ABS3I7W8_9MICO|nr:ACP S-malonyltransferase [Myceligenerans salitolerans]MBO0609094.1 ACP S-malonyltransferase [Myceligenerans salitolerans]